MSGATKGAKEELYRRRVRAFKENIPIWRKEAEAEISDRRVN